jgi:hypothetical protein
MSLRRNDNLQVAKLEPVGNNRLPGQCLQHWPGTQPGMTDHAGIKPGQSLPDERL